MIFNNMLSLNDAPNYSTWFYLWRTQGGATQLGSRYPGVERYPGVLRGASIAYFIILL